VAFAVGFIFYSWLTHDAGLAGAASPAVPRAAEADAGVVIAEADIRNNGRARLAVREAGHDFASRWQEISSESILPRASFGERFAFDRPEASLRSAQMSFDDRFSGDALVSEGPVRAVATTPHTMVAASATPAPRPVTAPRVAARSVVARHSPKRTPKAPIQLASASETSLSLAYAPAEPATGSDPTGSLKRLLQTDSNSLADIDTRHTAIYDISSHTVYLPNGRRLEAHSGLGSHMDDPHSVARKNTGVTPPNVYDLKMRESPFHGVRAIRLIPKDDSKMYGRSGMLAHTYMLGPNGQSNGCVSFKDYAAFLNAYESGDVTHLVVVEHLAGAPSPKTAAEWFSNAFKKIFRRS
jgi:hypothetical protein